jgi:hypothetical protein
MGPADVLPLIDVHHVYARPDHIGKRGTSLLERRFNLLQRLNRLCIGIPLANET